MDGPEEKQDPSAEKQDPSAEQKETSEQQEPQTFTQEERDKAVSDALSAAGRDAKSITDKSAEATRILEAAQQLQRDTKAERERWQDERDEAERESVRTDTDALKSVEERQRQRRERDKLAEDRRKLDDDTAKHQEKFQKADQAERREKATEIATRHNVDAETLIKFTDGSPEAMEGLAQTLPKKGEPKPALKIDSSKTVGAKGRKPTLEEVQAASPAEYDAKVKSGEWVVF